LGGEVLYRLDLWLILAASILVFLLATELGFRGPAHRGFIQVNQQRMVELRDSLGKVTP